MDKPFEGWNRDYEKNYNRIFRKSFLQKAKEFIDKLLVDLLIKKNK